MFHYYIHQGLFIKVSETSNFTLSEYLCSGFTRSIARDTHRDRTKISYTKEHNTSCVFKDDMHFESCENSNSQQPYGQSTFNNIIDGMKISFRKYLDLFCAFILLIFKTKHKIYICFIDRYR